MKTKFKLGPNQKKWLKALESGKYKRGKESLKVDYGDGFKYCCLGIACEVAGANWIKAHDDGCYTVNGRGGFLPKSIMEWLGVFYNDGSCPSGTYPSMIAMNDEKNLSFKEIAARIRKRPEEYFKESK